MNEWGNPDSGPMAAPYGWPWKGQSSTLNPNFFIAKGIDNLPNPFQLWQFANLWPILLSTVHILHESCLKNFRRLLTWRIVHSLGNLSLFKYCLSDVVLGSAMDPSSSRRLGCSMRADALPTFSSGQSWPCAFPSGAPEEGGTCQAQEGTCVILT